jgi:hypothetical protein
MFIPVRALRRLAFTLVLGVATGLGFLPVGAHAQEESPITVSLNNLERVYSGFPAVLDPASDLTLSPGGLDDYTIKITYAGKTTAPKNAGSYAVKVRVTTKATPTRSANASGTLVIAKAPLHVSAGSPRRLLGVANPPLPLTYEGFVADETSAVLNLRPVARTTATLASPAGDYPVTVVGGADNNYEIVERTPGSLTVLPSFPGTYEALLFDLADFDTPVGKLVLTLPARGAAFTGRLDVAREGASMPLSGKLSPDGEMIGVAGSASRRNARGEVYRVAFSANEDGLSAALYFGESGSVEESFLYDIPPATRLATYTRTSPFPGAAAYTLVLVDAASVYDLFFPGGSGFATASIASDGTLKFTGRLADGATLTASAMPDGENGYRVFARPYGTRTSSYASAEFALQAQPESPSLYRVPAAAGASFYWRKAPRATDTLFPEGFGPLDSLMLLDPWTPPAKPGSEGTLAQRLGLAAEPLVPGLAFIDYGPEYLSESENDLADAINVTTANKLTPVLIAPPANPSAWKITSLNLANGRFTGAFTLTDTNLTTSRPYKREVIFQGILRQAPADDPIIGAGYFLLKPVPGSFETNTLSVDLRFRKQQ